ncbi:MAG: SPOR domain-containing protein [Bacteroidia bacterium]
MNKQVSVYISELLYRNDCVIVSGFGGFVARHVPASLLNSGSLLTPPAKSVLFNKNLKSNDGLLANYIMDKQQLSYSEANRIIQVFAQECSQHLEMHYRLELENIGVLYLDGEKNIQFEPLADINYLIGSFGLSPLFAQPLQIEEPLKPVETEDRKPVIEERPQLPLSVKKRNYRRIAALAVGLPLLLTALLFTTQTAPLKNTVFANLNPFGTKTEAKYRPLEYKKKAIDFTSEKTMELHPDANGYGSFKVSDNSGYIIVNICDTVTTDKTFVKKHVYAESNTAFSGKFQVVLGCFSIEDNAQRLVNTLHSRNIHAAISGTTKKGLHIVSAGGFKNIDSARALLQQVRQNYPSAWLMTE